MSSSVFRALRSAGYPDAGIIAFATSLLSELCDEREKPEEDLPPQDAQTGLPTGPALLEILQFELQRALATRHAALGLVVVTLHERQLCSATERFADENLIVEALRSRARHGDTVGQTDKGEFVLVLPGAGARAVAVLAEDVHRGLHTRTLSRGARIEVRHAFLDQETGTAAAFLRSVRRAAAVADPGIPPAASTTNLLGRPIALALCGGAAMAAAHVGVLSAIDDLGGRVSGLGATSAGALVAAMYASGLSREAMLDKFLSLRASAVYARIRTAYAKTRLAKPRRGMSRARVGFASSDEVALATESDLRELVEHFVPHDRPIESLPIRLAFSATDLSGGRTTYISHGSLHDGLMAACAVPGLFPPQRSGSKLLVDGSLAGELPVAAATSIAGEAAVIGSYLVGPDTAPKSFDSGIAVAARVAAIRERELVSEQTRVCETVLRIPVEDVGWMGFSRCRDAVRIGRDTALRELAEASTRRVTPPRRRRPPEGNHTESTSGSDSMITLNLKQCT